MNLRIGLINMTNKTFKITTWEECSEEYEENHPVCNQCHDYNRCWLKALERKLSWKLLKKVK